MTQPFFIVLFRWLHIVAACVALGGVFFMRVIVPAALSAIDENQRETAILRMRRIFKMVIHTAILLFLVSGIYNSWLNWDGYHRNPTAAHPLWGTHVLLAVVAFGISLFVLARPKPPAKHKTLMAVNLALLLVTIAVASTLKYAREHPPGITAPITASPAVVVEPR